MFIELEAIFVIVAESPEDTTKLVTARLPIVAESAVAVVLAISPVTETPVFDVDNFSLPLKYNLTELFSVNLARFSEPSALCMSTRLERITKFPVPPSSIKLLAPLW